MVWLPLLPKINYALHSLKSIKQAFQIHAQLILNGHNEDIFYLSRLISFLALSGSHAGLVHSRLLFSNINQPNVFIWNTMIRGYSRSDSPLESILLFKSMLATAFVSPNNFTFPFLINSCAKLWSVNSGQVIHCYILKTGFESDLFIRNSLIHFYSSFGCLDYAQQVFDRSSERDVVSFNTMITGYARYDRPTDALRLFGNMRDSDIAPDEFTIVALLSACSALNDSNAGKLIHLLIYKNLATFNFNNLLKSALVDMYAKCGLMEMADRVFCSMGTNKTTTACSSMVLGYAKCGDVDVARCLFDQMLEKDLVSWTIMINGYTQAGRYSEALELFVQMEVKGFKPDEITLASALSACARLGALETGERIHHQYMKSGLYSKNLILTTAIIDMYAKCGSLETALQIFSEVDEKSRTVSLYNVVIYGLAQHGDSAGAMKTFKEMESAGLRPDEVTFVGVLCACSHGGLVEEGKLIFDSMQKVHRVEPQIEHYCCLVDLLGRSGHVEEAHEFIQRIPCAVNSVVWRSLLGSCKLHDEVEIGEIAAKRLLETEPDHGARYVVLSNMLTNARRWEDAGKVREVMEAKGISKPAGWSYIEANGDIHRFQASDKSHPHTNEIHFILEDLAVKSRSIGNVLCS